MKTDLFKHRNKWEYFFNSQIFELKNSGYKLSIDAYEDIEFLNINLTVGIDDKLLRYVGQLNDYAIDANGDLKFISLANVIILEIDENKDYEFPTIDHHGVIIMAKNIISIELGYHKFVEKTNKKGENELEAMLVR